MNQLDSADLSPVIERMGGAMALASSARKHRAFLRARGIKSAVDLLRLAFMYGPGGYSLRALAAMAAADDVADVSDVAVLERLKRTADWLQSLCEEALSRVAAVIGTGLVQRPIRIVDSSRIEGPGSRVWRLHLCYDAGLARIVDAAITTTRDGDRLDRFVITPGEIRIGDRGFAQPDKIKRALVEGADVLVRLSWKGLQLTRSGGEPIDWMNLFDQAAAQGSLDMPVLMHKAHSAFEPVALRLVLIKKPPAAAAKARAKTRRASQRNQNRIDPRTLASADYVILLTSLGCNEFPVSLLGAFYRLRWQVELAIKRLKSSCISIDCQPKMPIWHEHGFTLICFWPYFSKKRLPSWMPFPPQRSSARQMSVWRTTVLLAAAFLASVWPPPRLQPTMRILASRIRQITEPPRRRKLQIHAIIGLS